LTLSTCRPLSERERANPTHAKHRRQLQKQRERLKGKNLGKATLHQATQDRLYQDALHDARFAEMSAEEVKAYLEPRLVRYLSTQPWWFGHFDKPTREGQPASAASIAALKRYRDQRRQEALEREARINERVSRASRVSAQFAERQQGLA